MINPIIKSNRRLDIILWRFPEKKYLSCPWLNLVAVFQVIFSVQLISLNLMLDFAKFRPLSVNLTLNSRGKNHIWWKTFRNLVFEENLILVALSIIKAPPKTRTIIHSLWIDLKNTNGLEPIKPLRNQPPIIEGKTKILILVAIIMSKSASPL